MIAVPAARVGTLFYGDLTNSRLVAVHSLTDTSTSTSTSTIDLSGSTQDGAVNTTSMQWIDTLAVDLSDRNNASIYFTSNRLNYWIFDGYDLSGASGANFRIIK